MICNFANADMVGHTGNVDATIAAVETLDACLGPIMTALRRSAAPRSSPPTTATPSRCGTTSSRRRTRRTRRTRCRSCSAATHYVGRRLQDGSLRDVAPTILDLLEIPPSPEMTGSSLIEMNQEQELAAGAKEKRAAAHASRPVRI